VVVLAPFWSAAAVTIALRESYPNAILLPSLDDNGSMINGNAIS
jgi:hypothetical protein